MTPDELHAAFLAAIDRLGDRMGAEVAEFRGAVEMLGSAPYERAGEPGSLSTILFVDSGGYDRARRVPDPWPVYQAWASQRRMARERDEAQRLAETTWTVRYFRGASPGKPERIARDQAMVPWSKRGTLVLEERARVRGSGFDSQAGATFALESTVVGAERDEGTVVAKRVIYAPDQRVQYLVRPRSAAAEKIYQARKRLAEVDYQLRQVDYITPERARELDAERGRLAAIVGDRS